MTNSPSDDIHPVDLETADEPTPTSTTTTSSTHTDLEVVFEYTSITGHRRRVTIVPDTGGEAWRIEHERRAGEWRETGREPITEFDLHVRGRLEEHNAREIDPDPRSQSAVPDGGNVRESFLTVQNHYCDICSRPFDTLDDLANHDCRRHPESG